MSVPYLGSKISLISKAEIRYEGILYSIDPNESTVALAKVRSFGTEDRPTDRPVPMRDEIFEYIIFRGRDIKDLHVCAPPQPMSNDPAIVQSSEVSNINSNNNSNLSPGLQPQDSQQVLMQHRPPPPGLMSPHKLPSMGDPSQPRNLNIIGPQQSNELSPGGSTDVSQLMHHHLPPPGLPGNSSHHSNYDNNNDYNNDNHPSYQHHHNNVPNEGGNFPNNDYYHPGNAGGGFGGSRGGGSSRGGGPGFVGRGGRDGFYDNNIDHYNNRPRQNFYNSQHQYNQHYQHPNFRGSSNFSPNNRGRPRVARTGRGGQRLKFDQEFDFESSNAQFDKEQIERELREKLSLDDRSSGDHHHHQQQQQQQPNKPNEFTIAQSDGANNFFENDGNHSDNNNEQHSAFYDKTKSFFDRISCDALDKNKRTNWKEERKLNCETFGLTNSIGRGGGGGGGYYYRGFNSRPRYNNYYRGAPRRAGGFRGYGGGGGGREEGSFYNNNNNFNNNNNRGRGRPTMDRSANDARPS